MSKHEIIDGKKLRTYLAERGESQIAIAKRARMDHFMLNRWCRRTDHRVLRSNLELLAGGLEMTMNELLTICGPTCGDCKVASELSPSEQEMVDRFRFLSPVEQAKALIEFVNQVEALHESRLKLVQPR